MRYFVKYVSKIKKIGRNDSIRIIQAPCPHRLFSSERSLDYPTKFSFSRPDLGRLGHFRRLQHAHQKGRIACSGGRRPRIRFNARFGACRG